MKWHFHFSCSLMNATSLQCKKVVHAKQQDNSFVKNLQVSDLREHQYETLGIGSSYLFRVDDDIVVLSLSHLSVHTCMYCHKNSTIFLNKSKLEFYKLPVV
jgi:hypothetical protein